MDEKNSMYDVGIAKALVAVEIENENLHNCLYEITETRKFLETNLESVQNQLADVVQETYQLESINAKNAFKIQKMDVEVYELEEKQKVLTEQIKISDMRSKKFKENSDIKINDFTRKADNLCELFLSAVHIETNEYMKIFSDISKLKSELIEKEAALFKFEKELEEFVFYGESENQIELLVSMDERQFVMNFLEDQLLTVKNRRQGLESIKAEKQIKKIN